MSWSDYGKRGLHEGGGTVQNTLKGVGTEKRGGETKNLKRGASGVKDWVP